VACGNPIVHGKPKNQQASRQLTRATANNRPPPILLFQTRDTLTACKEQSTPYLLLRPFKARRKITYTLPHDFQNTGFDLHCMIKQAPKYERTRPQPAFDEVLLASESREKPVHCTKGFLKMRPQPATYDIFIVYPLVRLVWFTAI